tara:strand:- start:1220 stop:2215 length:996 start_codon:yes stop_codon:yes gene_type:complete
MNKPQKSLFLLGLAGLAAPFSASAAVLNVGSSGVVGGTYLGAETIRQSGDFNRGLLSSSQGVRVGGAYGDYETDAASDRLFDSDYDVTSGSLGYIHEFDGFKLGASLTTVDTDFSSESTDTNEDVSFDTDGDGFFFALGASKSWDKLEIILQGGAGELSLDSTRDNQFGQKDSDYDVSLYFFSVTALYDLYRSETFGVKPFIELGYMSIESDSFTEDGVADNVSVDTFEDEVPYILVGADFEYLGFENALPYLSLAVWSDLGDDSVEVEGADVFEAPYEFETPDAAETLLSATLGLGYAVTESLELDASVGVVSGDDVSGSFLALSGTFTF